MTRWCLLRIHRRHRRGREVWVYAWVSEQRVSSEVVVRGDILKGMEGLSVRVCCPDRQFCPRYGDADVGSRCGAGDVVCYPMFVHVSNVRDSADSGSSVPVYREADEVVLPHRLSRFHRSYPVRTCSPSVPGIVVYMDHCDGE